MAPLIIMEIRGYKECVCVVTASVVVKKGSGGFLPPFPLSVKRLGSNGQNVIITEDGSDRQSTCLPDINPSLN